MSLHLCRYCVTYLIFFGHGISLSLKQKASTPVRISGKETLRISFQVVDKESGKGFQPHQTFLRFFDEKNNEEGIQPVRVTPGGKAKFDLVCLIASWFI